MPTDSGSSVSLKDSQAQAAKDRETFSHQTLLLTVLTAINNPNHHPSFNVNQVNQERVKYMQAKAARTPVIDAATTILVTDTEILATMACGVRGMQGILTLKATQEENVVKMQLLNRLENPDLHQVDEFPLDDFFMEGNGPVTDEAQAACKSSLFLSLPNPDIGISVQAPDFS